jgi:hypothetical protein
LVSIFVLIGLYGEIIVMREAIVADLSDKMEGINEE